MRTHQTDLSRRFFCKMATSFVASCCLAPGMAAGHQSTQDPQPVETSVVPAQQELSFEHLHTGERLDIAYAINQVYQPDALQTINHFLRDHYTGQAGLIDLALLDLLSRLRQCSGTQTPIQVISAYRCASTNSTLRQSRGGGVATRSLHMDGKAIDIRCPDISLESLRDAALSLRSGGVGYYPSDRFIHIDTGSPRYWQG